MQIEFIFSGVPGQDYLNLLPNSSAKFSSLLSSSGLISPYSKEDYDFIVDWLLFTDSDISDIADLICDEDTIDSSRSSGTIYSIIGKGCNIFPSGT